ncbi:MULTISPECIES: hypothetical protein [Xanthomarina]|uniref:Uncharacterized protein n=1 Tax=Xanthomarina gelatinilytica TaxID=1137281 RepID=M7N649_9FLAO|nr:MULTISPECIES: hypothetical protein [Xanthomarina]EMQ93888.1 hypothetical protein D778_01298 [Xanthomarina gelatinilytica]MCB0389061.1 hypothetical protein [Winogradskyella sp.]MDX1318413.1 hypothetical protein [Xanthomarina gelatinilytica]
MNTMDRSLCRTCRHVESCSLTSNKSFIWSCSEYELAEDTKTNIKPQTLTQEFLAATEKRAVELI